MSTTKIISSTNYYTYWTVYEENDVKENAEYKNPILFDLEECVFISSIKKCIAENKSIDEIINLTKDIEIYNKWDTYELELEAIDVFYSFIEYNDNKRWRVYLAKKWLEYKDNEEITKEDSMVCLWSIYIARKIFKNLKPELGHIKWPNNLKDIKKFVLDDVKSPSLNKTNRYWLWHLYHEKEIPVSDFENDQNNAFPQIDEEEDALCKAIMLMPEPDTKNIFMKYMEIFQDYGNGLASAPTTKMLDNIVFNKNISAPRKIAVTLGFIAGNMDSTISDMLSSRGYKCLKTYAKECIDLIDTVIDHMAEQDLEDIVFKLDKYEAPEKMSLRHKQNIVGKLIFKGVIDDIKALKSIDAVKSLYDLSSYKNCIKLYKMHTAGYIDNKNKDALPELPTLT